MAFDRWYDQEMRAPDGSYIKRIQDCSPEERRDAQDFMIWHMLLEREMFGTIWGMPVQKA